MALIGDVIISARELIPDMPQVLPNPTFSGPPYVQVTASSTSTLAPGIYNAFITFTTPWGETLPAPETTGLNVSAGQDIQVSVPLPPGANGVNLYFTLPGGAAGSEQQMTSSSVGTFLATFNLNPAIIVGNLPPTRNTAWMPDTNGQYLSAGTLYRWLNESLRRLALKVGGIQDYSCVASVQGQSLYQLVGMWKKIQSVWYDGFPLGLGNQRGFFRRNQIQSSILASAAISINTNQAILEVFYQPIRTAGSTTVATVVQAADTVINTTGLTGYQPFGPPMFARIGGPGGELIAYAAQSGAQLTGCIRGIGGTTPQLWGINAPVDEMNIPVLGKRLHTATYVPGNASNTLPLPVGWESVIIDFIRARGKNTEQDEQAASEIFKKFDEDALELLRANRQIAGPVQVGDGMYGAEVVPGLGTEFGGVVLP